MSLTRPALAASVVLVFVLGFALGTRRAPSGAPTPAAPEPGADPLPGLTGNAPRALAEHVRSQAPATRVASADLARRLVFDNSEHGGRENELSAPDAAERVYRHLTAGQPPPRLSCGPRTLVLTAVLDELGVESRIVHVFSDDFDSVRSHTFVEIRDDVTATWQIEDPDMNVTYVEKSSGLRVGADRLLLERRRDFEPCTAEGDCGWRGKTERLRDHYFEAVMYDRRHTPEASVIVVNTARFSISKPFSGNGGMDFLAFAYERYYNPAVGRGRAPYWPTLVLRRGAP